VKRRKSLKRAIFDAVEREQRRFACDLHDGICQELAGITMFLDMIPRRVAPDVATDIRSLSEHIRRVALDARRLALGLAPIAVERDGLVCALALLKLDVETLNGPTIVISVDEPFARELPLYIAVNLYRIAQEATANALRHSGASHIDISLQPFGEGLSLVIQDDGSGIRDIGSGSKSLGIGSMASRAKWLGGELKLLPGTRQGTKVQVIVPVTIIDPERT
jgi:signal transduction histidine kinase